MFKAAACLWALIAAFTLGATAQAAERLSPLGSRISLIPPAGLVESNQFMGYMDPNGALALQVIEAPGDLMAKMRAGMTREDLARNGMNLIDSEPLTDLPFDAQLVRFTKTVGGVDQEGWTLLADGHQFVAIVMITQVKASARLTDAGALDVLKTVRLRQEAASDPVATLPFSVAPSARFKFRLPMMGRALALTQSPAPPPTPPKDPYKEPSILITTFLARIEPAQQRSFAERVAGAEGRMEITATHDITPVRIGELSGWQVTVDGIWRDTRNPAKVVFVVLFSEGRVYCLQGIAPSADFDAVLKDFRATFATFKPRP